MCACLVVGSFLLAARAAVRTAKTKPIKFTLPGEDVARRTSTPDVPPPIERKDATQLKVDAAHAGKQAATGTEVEHRIAALKADFPDEIQDKPGIAQLTKEIQIQHGNQVYLRTCFVCHQPDGQGIPGQFPPLAGSDYLMADMERSIRIVLAGQSGELTVNGKKYNGVMLPLDFLSDEDIANVLTYVRNSMSNSGEVVSPDLVRRIRASLPKPQENSYE